MLFERISASGRLSLSASLFFFLLLPLYSHAQDTVCAEVKIEIAQELTIERQAFEATLKIENTLADKTIENIHVVVEFRNKFDELILATSDPNDTNASFFIRINHLDGINDISGDGTLGAGQSANATWLIIPAPGASEGVPSGTLYFVGATFNYRLDGIDGAIEVAPDSIYVKPMPLLTLDYFLPFDVFADNPLTLDIVEPAEPFSLGVRVQNNGNGEGQNIKIESAQPKIVENEQELLIDFTLLDSYVQNDPVNNSLLIELGNIPAGEAKMGRWNMQTSLSGRFKEFSAEFSHSDELGGELTSLIEAANTHTLIRDVIVDVAGRDNVSDFLAYELSGALGDIYIYESNSTTSPVVDQSAAAVLSSQFDALSFSPMSGFSYAQVADPFLGAKQIDRVIRSDGKDIRKDNVWFSKRYNRTSKEISYHLNIFDANSTGEYTLSYADQELSPSPPVLQFISLKTTYEGSPIGFLVEASDADKTIPLLSVNNLPEGASFTDNNNGSGIFLWTPATGQSGSYEIQVVASDNELSAYQSVTIVVNSALDTDGDGLLDSWELENFGDLSRDGSGDADGDGVLDRDEFDNGTNPLAINLAVMVSPINGTTLASNSVHFIWNNVNADRYTLDIGTEQGGNNLVDSLQVNTTDVVIENLPVDGRVFYVRLSTTFGDVQGFNDYVYTAVLVEQLKADMLAPFNDTQLTGDTVAFSWTDIGIDQYQLDIGTEPGGSDILQRVLTEVSTTVEQLPLDGRTLYVRLWSIDSSDGGYEAYNDYVYTAFQATTDAAVMQLPTDGATLSSDRVTFVWSDAQADEHYLEIGAQQGGNQLFSGSAGDQLQFTVSQLPVNGAQLYVRLWSIRNGIEVFNDYIYTAHTMDVGQAEILSPSSSNALTTRDIQLTWQDVDAQEYFLRIGSTIGASDIFYGSAGTSTTAQVSALPFDGRTLYVRLWSKMDGRWYFSDQTYTAYNDDTLTSHMLSPQPNSQLSASTVTFSWDDAQAQEYYLRIGSEQGGYDLFYGSVATTTQKTIANLPFDGREIHVRLSTRDYGQWRHNDYIYTAYQDDIVLADMLNPEPNSSFSSRTVHFTWQDAAAEEYYLRIGTQVGGAELFYGSMGTATEKTITNLPYDGSDVHVRLFTKDHGNWRYHDYTYTAHNDGITTSAMVLPAVDSAFTSSTVTFEWQDANAEEYYLRIGSHLGGGDLFSESMDVATTKTVNVLPFDGRTVYVRLHTKNNGQWSYNDYTYTAYSDDSLLANIISPPANSTLASSLVTFIWEDAAAEEYFLRVGSEEGGSDIFHGSTGIGLEQTISHLPTDGRAIYLRLYTRDYGQWRYNDYTYTASDSNE